MSQSKGSKLYNTFVKGINTDASPLTFPDNTSLDEVNMRLLTDGTRRRRKGIDFEDDFVQTDLGFNLTDLQTQVISTHNWFSVGEIATKNFLVVQVFNVLYFYDYNTTPLSAGRKAFTVNLDSYLAPGKTIAGTEYVDTATGRGALFVCSAKILPIYITYNEDTDTVTVTQVSLKVRDSNGVRDSLAVDTQPSTLSTLHKYNLYNQGWKNVANPTDPDAYINGYKSSVGYYPSNAQQWQVGKLDDGTVNYQSVKNTNFGSTQSAQGRFILDAFYKDRTAVSGLSGLDVESNSERPSTLCGFSGRIWWALGSTLYFSQIIKEDLSNVGNCFQEADPTADDINALVDSDGGTVTITEAINIKAIRTLGNSLVVFATNGVWYISGNNASGFKATEFQVTNIADTNCINKTTIIRANTVLFWWSDTGIYGITFDSTTGLPQTQSISDDVIQTLFNLIPTTSRFDCKATFDPVNKIVSWLYRSRNATASNEKITETLLNFDMGLGAFYPFTIAHSNSKPFISDFIITPTISAISTDERVVVDGDFVILDDGEFVTVPKDILDTLDTTVKYLTVVPDGSTFELTISDFKDSSFVDWFSSDGVGTDAPAYTITGYLIEGDAAHQKQVPYILTYMSRTETGFTGNETDGYELRNPSGCLMQARWEWADSNSSNKWSQEQQVYRFRINSITPMNLTFDNGFPVIISKSKVRGRGRSLHLRFRSQPLKDMVILGWHIVFNLNTEE